MISNIVLELAEELVSPDEAVLDNQVEEAIESEQETLLGIGEFDDDIIEFIEKGKRFYNSDPIDFTDDDVDETLEDDDLMEE